MKCDVAQQDLRLQGQGSVIMMASRDNFSNSDRWCGYADSMRTVHEKQICMALYYEFLW